MHLQLIAFLFSPRKSEKPSVYSRNRVESPPSFQTTPNLFIFYTLYSFLLQSRLPSAGCLSCGIQGCLASAAGEETSRPFQLQGQNFMLSCYFQFRGHFPVIKLTVYLKVTCKPEENCPVLKAEQMMMLTMAKCQLSCSIYIIVSQLFTNLCQPWD